MKQIQIGQRVLYGDFGEGTIVKAYHNEDLVSVAFSEIETLELPINQLQPIIDNQN